MFVMNFKFLLIIGLLSFTLNSCNWVRHNLGMMTSGEIDELKKSYDNISATDTSMACTSDSSRLDSLNSSESDLSVEKSSSNVQSTSDKKMSDGNIEVQKEVAAKVSNANSSKSKINREININNGNGSGDFYIILGSFKSKQNAEKLYRDVINAGNPAALLQKDNGFVMVGVGGYHSLEEAENNLTKWKNNKLCSGGLWIYNSNTGR